MHSGLAQPVAPYARVLVSNQPIVTRVTLYTVSACSLATTSTPPCVTAQWQVAATRVLAGGAPVITQTSQAVCTPTSQGLLVNKTQTRVLAI